MAFSTPRRCRCTTPSLSQWCSSIYPAGGPERGLGRAHQPCRGQTMESQPLPFFWLISGSYQRPPLDQTLHSFVILHSRRKTSHGKLLLPVSQSNILLHVRVPRLIEGCVLLLGGLGRRGSDKRSTAERFVWQGIQFLHDSGRLAGGDRVQSHRTFIAVGKRLIYCKLFTQLSHYLWTRRINTGTHSHS